MSAMPAVDRIELSPAVRAILEADSPQSRFLKHFVRYLEALLAPDPAGLDIVVPPDGRCHELETIGLPRALIERIAAAYSPNWSELELTTPCARSTHEAVRWEEKIVPPSHFKQTDDYPTASNGAINRWVDEAVVAVLRQNCVKTSGHRFSGTQIHAPKKVCHNGRFSTCVTA